MPQNPLEKFLQNIGYFQTTGEAPAPAPAPEYKVPQPPATRQEAIQPMKNYGLLTQPERQLFERFLPGVRGSWAGSVMNWAANNPIASTILPWLDVLAEGTERFSGLVNQMEYYKPNPITDSPAEYQRKMEATKHLFNNLGATWTASQLNYNFADLPQLILGDIQEEGLLKGSNIRGIRLPDDMPGVEGLNRAREMLIAGASMEEVEAAFEEEMGALWMRGQMYDMYGHILLDPLNYLMPYLAPIGKSALASKIKKVTRIFNVADDVILDATKMLAKAVEKGNKADVLKYTEILEGQKGLTTFEKIGDFLAGGRELLPDEALKAPTDASWLRKKMAGLEIAARKGPTISEGVPLVGGKHIKISAPHTLTPASRGVELTTMVGDSYDAHIFQLGQNIFEKAEGVQRFADGAISGQFAKYFLTPEGRLVQGFTKGIAAASKFRLKQYTDLLGKGIISDLGVMAKTLGTTVDDIATQLVHGKGIDELAETFGRSADELTEIGRQLKGSPWSEELWQLAVSNDIKDVVEHASIAMYGIHQRGKPQAWSGALKSAETLAWLKMNPSFPVKNFFTDEMIMFMEGVTGKMSIKNIDEYWKAMGFDTLPQRVKQGIGMAGLEGGEGAARGLGPISEMTMGKPGALAKFSKWVNGIDLGPLDMANYAQKIESRHSAQAFTVYYQKAMKQYWKAGVGFDPIDGVVSYRTLELMEAAEPGLARKFNNWASSAEGKKGLDDFLDANYNISIDEILDEARVALGYDVDLKQALPDEYLINLKIGLPKAAAGGEGEIRKFLGKFRRDLQEHLDELATDLVQRTTERAATQVKLEGPYAMPKLFEAAMDDLQGFHVTQAMEAAKIEDLLQGANKAAAGQFWARHLPEVEQTWGRAWDRTGAILKGIRQGTEGKLPKRVTDIYGDWSGGWKKFYKVRNADYKAFFDARKAGKTPHMPWDTMKAKHNMMYMEGLENETKLLDEMYELVAKQLDNPETAELFRNASRTVSEARLKDKQSVVELQEQLIGASAVEKQRLWNEFWQGRYSDPSHTFEQAANAAMQGNKEAAEQFARAGEEAAPLGKAAEELRVGTLPDDFTTSARDFVDEDFLPLGNESVELFHVTTAKDKVTAEGLLPRSETGSVGLGGGVDDQTPNLISLTFDEAQAGAISERLKLGARAARGDATVDDIIEHFGTVYNNDEMMFKTANSQTFGLELPIKTDDFGGIDNYEEIATELKRFYEDGDTESLYELVQVLDDGLSKVSESPAFESGIYRVGLTGSFDDMKKIDPDQIEMLRVGARKGVKPEHIADELELRFTPEDVFVIDDTIRPATTAAEAVPADTVTASADNLMAGRKFLTGTEVDTPLGKGVIFGNKVGTKAEGKAIKYGVGDIEGQKTGRWFEAEDITPLSDDLPTYKSFDELPEEVQSAWNSAKLNKDEYAKAKAAGSIMEQDLGKSASGSGRHLSATLKNHGLTADDVRLLRGELAPKVTKPKTYLPDINQFWPEEPPIALAQDQFWFNRGFLYIDAVEQAAIAQAAKKPLKIAEVLPTEAIDEISSWIGQTQAKYGDINNAAVRMGEYGRDAALLNYSRRYNYNTWLGTVAPYEFWMTQSMMKWALHSIDHPAMLSTYMRYQKMMETVGAPNQQIPSRLKDHFKIDLPFLPDWMGNSIWANPTRLMLPFEQYSYPFKEWNKRIRTKEGRAEYLINQWAEDGTITHLQAEEALAQQGGDLWRRAIDDVEGESSDLRTGPFDFATIFASPHAPIMWAYHALKDETEKISPIMPLTRYSKAAQGLLGPGIAGDVAGIPHQVEARVRTALGLPAFDAWDDYRIERMMTNLAGEGKYPYDEVMRQWIAKEGPIWDEAKILSDKEFGVSGMASAIGLSLKAYPPGEEKQRMLQQELRNAWDLYEQNPDADPHPVKQFYDKHPEYNARQALWKTPEERMQRFMLDLLYDKWNNMTTLHKKQVREVIGDDIDAVLYPDDAEAGKTIKEEIPIGILQNWLMTMGGDVPGENEGFAMPVDFIDPVVANRAQVYYDSINQLIPEFWNVSDEYYENPENLRKQWGRANPEKYAVMKAGWDFKRDWLWRNPDVAPYITDNEDWWRKFSTIQEREEVIAQTPDFRPEELIAAMPQEAQRLVYDYIHNREDIPEPIEDMLEEMAMGLGMSVDELLNMLVDNR